MPETCSAACLMRGYRVIAVRSDLRQLKWPMNWSIPNSSSYSA